LTTELKLLLYILTTRGRNDTVVLGALRMQFALHNGLSALLSYTTGCQGLGYTRFTSRFSTEHTRTRRAYLCEGRSVSFATRW